MKTSDIFAVLMLTFRLLHALYLHHWHTGNSKVIDYHYFTSHIAAWLQFIQLRIEC